MLLARIFRSGHTHGDSICSNAHQQTEHAAQVTARPLPLPACVETRSFPGAEAQGSAPPAAASDSAPGAFGTMGGLSAANGATGRRPAARAGNVRSLGDLAADEDNDDSEEDGDETNELYTGGATRCATPCLPALTVVAEHMSPSLGAVCQTAYDMPLGGYLARVISPCHIAETRRACATDPTNDAAASEVNAVSTKVGVVRAVARW